MISDRPVPEANSRASLSFIYSLRFQVTTALLYSDESTYTIRRQFYCHNNMFSFLRNICLFVRFLENNLAFMLGDYVYHGMDYVWVALTVCDDDAD